MPYGRQTLSATSLFPTRVSANGFPEYKIGGITLDLTTLAAAPAAGSADVVWPDGSIIKASAGRRLRYGQIFAMITASGKYGPYDPAAADGREILQPGRNWILDEAWVEYPSGPTFVAANDIIGGVFDGGPLWIDRVLHSGVAAHTLAAGPTLAEFLAAFPKVQIVRN